MAWPPSDASEIPARPALNSQQSSSLPSTPYQHARNLSFHSQSPSPVQGSTSPRSTHSESAHLPPSARKPLDGCKYETAMAYFRRRMPYSLGAEVLPEDKDALKEKLEPEAEKKLTADIMDLYDELLPSAESDDRRRQLLRKLEKLFNEQWPGHEIKVHVFGSSGNKLCSSDSDVDICITTDYKELEHVCKLAEVLAKHGMERVVCVSHAKVPIVKIWDPELRLACDMNVNNTLALENTRMIRTYVEVDERVRPLAMAIKHWTKKRILNDAALGGTLSSYTWICLIINFLQTRDPPILPSLQARPHEKKVTPDGLVCSFDDDLKSLASFGRKNQLSVGALFYQFFRYYGHEVEYQENVISVRQGGLISKEAKGWNLLMNNGLCVEEPFNTSRNLGNTADDTSFRGLHIELRRAFKSAVKGDLADCCLQYEYPPEEERTWERPPPQPRPTLTPALPSRGGRGGGRGGRYTNQFPRGGFAGSRRASNTANRANSFRQPNMPSELSMQAQQQAQQQAQTFLHDQLWQQIQLLQAQEQELRLQLHNQALITGRPPPVIVRQPFIQFPVPQQQHDYTGDENARSRSGTVNNPGLTMPPRQIYNPTYASISASNTQGSTTNPPSPSAASVLPEFRRNPRRSSNATGSRAHSQPARGQNSPSLQNFPPLYTLPQPLDSKRRPPPESSEGDGSGEDENGLPPNSLPSNGSRSDSIDDNQPQGFQGLYNYISPPQLQTYQQPSMLPLSSPMGLTLPNGYTPYVPVPHEYRPGVFQTDAVNGRFEQTPTAGSKLQRSASRPTASRDRGPLIVDGSVPPTEHRAPYASELNDPYGAVSQYTSTSDDHTINTPASFSDSLSQDFQDVPFEMEQLPGFTRPSADIPKPNGIVNAQTNGANGQPELLASRLQNYHLSNAEKLAQSQTQAKALNLDRQKNGSGGGGKDTVQSKQPGDKSAQHSNDNRHQTNHSKRRQNGVELSEKVNGANHKSKSNKGRQDASHNSSNTTSDSKERHVDQHRGKSGAAGGSVNGVNDSSHGGWQTTKKKHRKTAKSSLEPRNTVNGNAEPLPADESMRKGG
ncbi:uncharacterized protein PFLUO_LOCUS6211 [Penicillium psychrofluorescens]|uniref:uncharacterized protein n=1 Tax=Penicillium psychrofluorescens TaxID=3158075 RepID=UPI003CCD59DB